MINNEYIRRLEKIEAVLDSWLPGHPSPEWIKRTFDISVEPLLTEALIRPGRDLLDRGGKRWRPLLMVLVAESLGGNDEAALPLTPLVELCHNASLIHDDIEDNSDERRGGKAVHLIYGNDTAINSGAFLYFLPLACISSCNLAAETKTKIWEVWGEHLRRLHLGQSMDIAWHRDYRSLPPLADYELMCRLKTGCLARMAAELGVYCVNPRGEELAESYGGCAESLGLGFQILDDVKNLKTGVQGKKRGDDITEGKKSLPVLLYLHRYPEKLMFAERCFSAARSGGVSVPEVEEFIGVLEEAGVLDEAMERGNALIEESRGFFRAHGGGNAGGNLLTDFADLIN